MPSTPLRASSAVCRTGKFCVARHPHFIFEGTPSRAVSYNHMHVCVESVRRRQVQMLSRLGASLATSLILLLAAFPQVARRGEATFEPYALTTYDGQTHPAELGRLRVPENRHGKSPRLIQIAFVRLKSSAATPRAPIIYLSGGPGVPAKCLPPGWPACRFTTTCLKSCARLRT